MELEITGPVLKHFRSALTCLSRLGQDLDFTCTEQRLSVSTVNSSRTAFGIVHFYPSFFTSYSPLQATLSDEGDKFRFSVNAKALLSTLRPRSANTVESCTLSVHDSNDRNHHEPGVDSGECRIIVYLHCQHGVRKKHSLTYSQPAIQSWARFDLNAAPCHWTASSRVLKDWMTHFHERAGSGSGGGGGGAGTDEVTFYCARQECRLKSFNDVDRSGPTNDVFMTRALSTEVAVDTADFDTYHVPSPPSSSSSSSSSASGVRVVTFAQKEFKAIINLAEPLQAPLTAHFSTGGRPIMFSLSANDPSRGGASSFEAKFVIATTDFDSGGCGGGGEADGIKREKSESVAQRQQQQQQRGRTGTDGSVNHRRGGGAPLFNAPTPSPAPEGKGKGKAPPVPEEDEFDAAFDDDADLDDAFFADLDRATQLAMSQAQTQTRPTTAATTTTLASEKQPQQPSEEEGEEEGGDVQLRSGVGKEFGGTAAWSAPAAAPRSDDDDGGGGDGRCRREGAEEHENGHDHDPEPDTGGGVGVGDGGRGTADEYGGGHDEFVWEDAAGGGETQLGPTQVIRDDEGGGGEDGSGGSAADDSSGGEGRRSVKRARWNLLGDG